MFFEVVHQVATDLLVSLARSVSSSIRALPGSQVLGDRHVGAADVVESHLLRAACTYSMTRWRRSKPSRSCRVLDGIKVDNPWPARRRLTVPDQSADVCADA